MCQIFSMIPFITEILASVSCILCLMLVSIVPVFFPRVSIFRIALVWAFLLLLFPHLGLAQFQLFSSSVSYFSLYFIMGFIHFLFKGKSPFMRIDLRLSSCDSAVLGYPELAIEKQLHFGGVLLLWLLWVCSYAGVSPSVCS